MLSEKLEEARVQTRNHRLRNLSYLLGAILFVAAFLTGVIKFDFEELGFTKEATISKSDRQQAPMVIPLSPNADQSPAPSQFSFPKSSPRLSSSSGSSTPSISAEVEEERESFKTALARFEQEFFPQVMDASFSTWSPTARQDILKGRDAAVSDFGKGSYTTALEKISEITNLAVSELRARDNAFNVALTMAHTALEVDDRSSAESSIDEALRLKPESVEAGNLKEKIERLAKTLPLIEAAAVARVENDLEKEERFLKSALALDPSRVGLKNRLEVVSTEIRESEFGSLIDAGMSAVGRRDIQEARRNLKLAKTIFKVRRELDVLSDRTERLDRELRIEKLLERAHAAAEEDSWVDAEQIFRKASEISSSNKIASKGRALAHKINSSDRQVSEYIRAPHRLATPKVAQSARVAIEAAQTVDSKSPKLSAKIDQLLILIAAYSTEVPVRVVSDGNTEIAVRGVGIVGKTSERTILLKPGEYTFEGTRPGFRSKLVAVSIPVGSKKIIVEILCDERI